MAIVVITCMHFSVGVITNYHKLRAFFSHSCAGQKSRGYSLLFLVSQTGLWAQTEFLSGGLREESASKACSGYGQNTVVHGCSTEIPTSLLAFVWVLP